MQLSPRQLYKDVIGKGNEVRNLETIQAGEDLKSLKENKGWKRIEEFIKKQEDGSDALLNAELGTITILALPRIFNTFLKYMYIVMERRAYRKIRNFVRISIETGEKYAQRRAKAEEAKK